MTRWARQTLTGAALLTAVVLVVEFQGFLYPEFFARWRAARIMDAHCKQWQLDTHLLVGPTPDQDSRPGLWCYWWHYNGSPGGTMYVVLRWDGSSELDGEQDDH